MGLRECDDIEPLETTRSGNLAPTANHDALVMGVVSTYTSERPESFAGRWIDRESGGVVVVAFTDDPEPHRRALLARAPSEDDLTAIEPPRAITDRRTLGERDDFVLDVVRAEHSEAELTAAHEAIYERLDPGAIGLSSSSLDVQRNIVWMELVDPTSEALSLVEKAVVDLPVCVNIFVSPVPPEGPLDIIPLPGEAVEFPPGLGRVRWELDPSFLEPLPTDTELHLLATEVDCASGREMGEALRGPQVVETDTEVIIAFAVETAAGFVSTCQRNPPTAVTVVLGSPLGERSLRDGTAPSG